MHYLTSPSLYRTITGCLLISILLACNGNPEAPKPTVTPQDSSSRNYVLDTVSLLTELSDSTEDRAYDLYQKLTDSLSVIKMQDRKFYIVEGDILMDGTDLYYYCQSRLQGTDSSRKEMHDEQPEMNAMTVGVLRNGNLAVWPAGKVIKYSVLRKSFSDEANYASVVQMIGQAASDWMKACNIKFEYVPAKDNMDPDENPDGDLTFVAREFNGRGAYVALSFFPGDPIYKRKLLIDPSFYSAGVSKVGVFRHELGHIIGLRHEQIWSTAEDCKGEKIVDRYLGARQVTPYDPYSVMHYLCGGVGSRELELTNFDREGIVKIYGQPR